MLNQLRDQIASAQAEMRKAFRAGGVIRAVFFPQYDSLVHREATLRAELKQVVRDREAIERWARQPTAHRSRATPAKRKAS